MTNMLVTGGTGFMDHLQSGIELNSKKNKFILKFWQIGYKQGQKDFKF
jgi:hypothetical protein